MRDRPRVAVIAHSHPDFSKGGGEVAAHREFLTLREAGWEATFLGACDIGAQERRSRAVSTIMPYAQDDHVFSFSGMSEDRIAWNDPWQRRVVVEFLAGLGADVYHFHHYWRVGVDLIADLMEARPDARFVMTLHEMLAICLNHGQMVRTNSRELCRREAPLRCLACFPAETLERLAFRKAALLATLRRFDHVVFPSAFLRQRYADWGLVPQRASVLENYLGDALAAVPRGGGEAGLSRRFGFFGQPTPFKGLDVLLRGFAVARAEDEQLSLSVYGADMRDALALFPDLGPVIEDLGSSVAFAGRYDPADALDLMKGVGWIVVPSIWWENSPVVIQEAMRAGTPLIVSDIGGMAEKVRPGQDGLHFKRGSAIDLGRAMLEGALPDTRERIGATLRDSVSRREFLNGLARAFAPRRAVAPAA